MRLFVGFLGAMFLSVAAFYAFAQPGLPGGGRAPRGRSREAIVKDSITRMMELDADKDGKLSRTEVNDVRLVPLFERADADKNGSVNAEELTVIFNMDAAELRAPEDGPPNGPGVAGSPDNQQGPHPGKILPPYLMDQLLLTEEQQAQLSELQREVDEKLTKILNVQQKRLLQDATLRSAQGTRPATLPGRGQPRPE